MPDDTDRGRRDPGDSGQRVLITNDGLWLPRRWDVVLDVLFEDARVWSFLPTRHEEGSDARRLVRWPERLKPFLDGVTHVTVREHLTQAVLVGDEEVRFGSRREPVRVVDPEGRALFVDKWGRLGRPFAVTDKPTVERLLDRMSEVLETLREDCGLPAFLAYGTLLGAVREGRLIAHDNDADVAYLSRFEHPIDIAREALQIQRTLRRKGWRVLPDTGFFKVLFREPDGALRNIDIFTAFYCEEFFHLVNFVRAPLPRSAIVPLDQVEFEGRPFPAPADTAAVLAATYGEGWRVPDPAFHYQVPPPTRRRFWGWFRGAAVYRLYWQQFYRNGGGADVPLEPSAFARWVAERTSPEQSVIDLGSGNGRDTLWFARAGRTVHGLDYAMSAVTKPRAVARDEGLTAPFDTFDLYDVRQVLVMGARLAAEGGPKTPKILYGRFLLDALEDEGRRNLWRLARMALRSGGQLYLEFRTHRDADARHVFADHFRRFLNPDIVVNEIESRGGTVEHREEGYGMARFRDEDPHVCRLVVRWSR